jgi:hypothetical protein
MGKRVHQFLINQSNGWGYRKTSGAVILRYEPTKETKVTDEE